MGSLMEYRLIAVFRNTSRSFSTGRPATTPYSCAHTRPVICAAANKRNTVGGVRWAGFAPRVRDDVPWPWWWQ